MSKPRVYVLPVTDVRNWCTAHGKEDDFALYVDEEMTEDEVLDIMHNTPAQYDPVCDNYSIRQFQAEFNFALEDKEITSNRYFIKIFED